MESFLERLSGRTAASGQLAIESLFVAHPSSLFFETDTTVLITFVGEPTSVSIAGDANNWSPIAEPLTRLEGTTFWWRRLEYESDARLDYKLVLNGVTWILDPANKRTSVGGFGPNSELRMPGYVDHPEIYEQPGIPRGTLVDTTVYSDGLGNERRIVLYLPPEYDRNRDSVGLIVVHDGIEFITLAGMPVILDNLIAAGSIPPVIAVFIPPVDRSAEYAGARMHDFGAFVSDEIVPGLAARYRIKDDPAMRVVMGASNGGNISLFMAMRYPGLFRNVAAFSSNVVEDISARFGRPPSLPLSIYLDIGRYDIPVLLPKVRSLVSELSDRGYSFKYNEFPEGHSWTNWKTHIDDALLFLLPRRDE